MGGAGSRPRALAPLSQPSLRALRARRAYSTEPNDSTEPERVAESTQTTEAADQEQQPTILWSTSPVHGSTTRPPIKTWKTEDDWARNRHLNRANLQEKFAPVKVDSLGRPTNIVVLRENVRSNGPRYVEHKEPEVVIETQPLNILADLEEDIGFAGAAEVIENIESLRPTGDRKKMTWEQIAELEKHLVRGFTTKQMMAYIQEFERKRQESAEKEKDEETEDIQPHQIADWLSRKEMDLAKPEEERKPHILSQTPWMPGRSEHGNYFENSVLRGYTSDAATQKSKVAMFIIRSCWGIGATEYESALGEVELKVTPEDLELLIAPRLRNPPLKKISDALVSTENEKIEAYRARDVVRITGTPAQTKLIASAIDAVLANIYTHKLSLAELKEQDGREFNIPFYEELERLTNSEVIRANKDLVVIKGMDLKPGSGLSTVADVARRVLLSSSDAADKSFRNVGFKMTDKPAYAVEWPLQEGMSWRQKMRHWARWESPIEKAAEKPVDIKEYVMELDELTGKKTSDAPKEVPIKAPESELVPAVESEPTASSELSKVASDALWHPTDRKSDAVIGNLLHEAVPGTTVSTTPVSFDVRDISESRTLFVPQDRNLARLVDHLPALTTYQRIFMKFLPSPWSTHGGEALSAFPAVEMQFSRHADEPLKLQAVYAISEDIHNDVMIPDRTLDLSFRQKTAFRISRAAAFGVPAIKDFLSKSQLDFRQGEILTPPELSLPIPSYICRKPGNMFQGKDGLEVPYLFSGLEFREYTTFNYHNWRLRYSSINGGKAAGQWSELALEYKSAVSNAPEHQQKSSEEILRDFTAAAFQLVDDLDTPRPIKARFMEDGRTEEREAPIKYDYLPSVRYCMIKKDVAMPKQFTCFNHRPQFYAEAEAEAKEEEDVEEVEEKEVEDMEEEKWRE